MVRDRISELQATRRSGSNFGGSLFQDVNSLRSSSKKIKGVLEKAAEIRELIKLIVNNVELIKDLHNNVLSHTNPDIRTELEGRTMIINLTAARIHKQLKEFIGDTTNTEDLSSIDTTRDSSTFVRIKILQYSTMRQMFADIMLEYNESLLRYHEKCSALLNQQRNLIKKSPSIVENVEEIVDEEKTSLFVDNILEDSRIARQQLSEIQSRHEEVLKLEKTIVEIRDIFHEMAFMVEKQGDQINCIEYFACQATENVDSGRCDLVRAEQKGRRYKRRKCKIIIISVLIVVLVLIIAVYL
ncbi:syntaxin-1A-like isoform X2 [Venturia canescens]|uniref:syntaxin-1A-like isoform X2 n=1 Tax=Venturia canescens TaxID=32260 RepID=UPI001C9CBB8A|nr:syntaxin-1A-like isoform X2 [Venturia canescens]